MAGDGEKARSKRSARLFDGPDNDPFAGRPAIAAAPSLAPDVPAPAERPRAEEPPPKEPPTPLRATTRGVTAPARESSGGLGALRRGARPQDPTPPTLGRRGPPTSQRPSPFKATALPAPDELSGDGEEAAAPPRRLGALPPPPAVLAKASPPHTPRPSTQRTPTIVETSGFSLLAEEPPDDGGMLRELEQAAEPIHPGGYRQRELPDDSATEEMDAEFSAIALEKQPPPLRLPMPPLDHRGPSSPPGAGSPPASVAMVEPETASPLLARARAASIRADSRPTPGPTALASGPMNPAGPSFPATAPPATNPLAQRLAQAAGPTPLAMPRQSLIPRAGTDPGTGPGMGNARPLTDPGGRRTPHPISDPGLRPNMALAPQAARPTMPQAPSIAPAPLAQQKPVNTLADVQRSLSLRARRRKLALVGTLVAILAAVAAVSAPKLTDLLNLDGLDMPKSAAVVAPVPAPPEPPIVAPTEPTPPPTPVVKAKAPKPPPEPTPPAPVEPTPPIVVEPKVTEAPKEAPTPVAAVEQGVLVVRSTPKGKVFIDNRPYGYTPLEKELEARVYTVRVIVPGYGSEERTVRVDPGRAAEVNVTFR